MWHSVSVFSSFVLDIRFQFLLFIYIYIYVCVCVCVCVCVKIPYFHDFFLIDVDI